MLTAEQLAYAYQQIRIEAERLAGRNGDLAQRATVYHHLYHHSRGNHLFPLIAAHGALWAKGYFTFGQRLGWALSWLTPFSAEARRQKLQLLDEFADAFRDVNRLVCIETYTTYHFTMRYGDHPQATDLIPRPLLEQLLCVHQASSSDVPLSAPAKRAVFEAFFLNEQETVVGPKINEANESFDWPLMRTIALMPHVKFAYMPGLGLQFRNFCDQSQRIKNGMRACDIALAVGLDVVERALEHYQILGDNFVETSEARFEQVRGV